MCVLVTDNAVVRLRGELTRWLLEVKPGVFVGRISASVRDRLWDKVKQEKEAVGALLVYSADTEQGFQVEIFGDPKRDVVDLDGVQLIRIR